MRTGTIISIGERKRQGGLHLCIARGLGHAIMLSCNCTFEFLIMLENFFIMFALCLHTVRHVT